MARSGREAGTSGGELDGRRRAIGAEREAVQGRRVVGALHDLAQGTPQRKRTLEIVAVGDRRGGRDQAPAGQPIGQCRWAA
jgi:hypothetical protein